MGNCSFYVILVVTLPKLHFSSTDTVLWLNYVIRVVTLPKLHIRTAYMVTLVYAIKEEFWS